MPLEQSGALASRSSLPARITMRVEGLPADIVVEGGIELA